MPVTGIKPTTMPTLIRTWKASTATTPITTNVPARSGAVCALWIKRISTIKYSRSKDIAPPNPSRADGDLGLYNLVPGALTVGFRTHEAGQTIALVRLQDVPGKRHHEGRQADDNDAVLQAKTSEEKAHDRDRDVGQAGAQVRLRQHKQHGDADQRAGLDEFPPGEFALAHVAQIFRHGQDQDQLDPFRRLEVLTSGQLDPAARAQIFFAEQAHRDQRAERTQVEPVNVLHDHLVADQADEKHHGESGGNPINLLNVGAGELGVQGGAVDLHDAEAADQQHEAQQEPVEIAK